MLFVGGLPTFSRIVGYSFVPSQEHLENTFVLAYVVAVAAGAVQWLAMRLPQWKEHHAQRGTHPGVIRATLLVGPLFLAYLGRDLVFGAYPMLHALISRDEVALQYVVEDVPDWSSGSCKSRVDLASMPLFFDRLCRVPEEARVRMKPGMVIQLRGLGSASGLFVKQVVLPPY